MERGYREIDIVSEIGPFAVETPSGTYKSVDRSGWYKVNIRGGGDVDLVDVIQSEQSNNDR